MQPDNQPTIISPTMPEPAQAPPNPAPAVRKIMISDGSDPAQTPPTPMPLADPTPPPIAPEPPAPPPPAPAPEPQPVAEPQLPPPPKPPAGPLGPYMSQVAQAAAPAPSPAPPEPQTTPRFGELQPKVDAHPLFSGRKDPRVKKPRRPGKWLWSLGVLLGILIVLYLLIDSGVLRGASHLPFHIFTQPATASQPIIQNGA